MRIAGLTVRDGFVVLAVGSPDARLTLAALDQALLVRDRPCIGAVSDGHAVVLLPAEPAALADDLIDAVTRLDCALVVHGGRATAAGQDDAADSAGLAISAARIAALRGVPLVDGESIAGRGTVAVPAHLAVNSRTRGRSGLPTPFSCSVDPSRKRMPYRPYRRLT